MDMATYPRRKGSQTSDKSPNTPGRAESGRQQSPRYDVRSLQAQMGGRVDSRMSPPRSPPRQAVRTYDSPPRNFLEPNSMGAETRSAGGNMADQRYYPEQQAEYSNGRNGMQPQPDQQRNLQSERRMSDQSRTIAFDPSITSTRGDYNSPRKSGFAGGYSRAVTLRAEFRSLQTVANVVVHVVDPLYYKVEQMTGMALSLVLNKYSGMLAALCFFPVMAVAIPVALFSVTIGLPLFIPFALIATFLAFVNGLIIAGLLAISPPGRKRIHTALQPLHRAVLNSDVGRRLVYEAGPRPSPLEVAGALVPRTPMTQLVVCVMLDAIGSASYLLPFLGEGADLAWAPVQAAVMGAMFNGVSPAAKYVGFLEEILPMTDILPSATLAWAHCNAATIQKLHHFR